MRHDWKKYCDVILGIYGTVTYLCIIVAMNYTIVL